MTVRHRDLRAEIVAALSTSKRGPLKSKELARVLRIPSHEYRSFRRLLTGLEKAGKIRRTRGHRYELDGGGDLVAGSLTVTRRGDGFVRPDDGRPDVFVPGGGLGSAMRGDRVVARIERRPRDRSPVGTIVDIVERARETAVGTLHRGKRGSFVVPLGGALSRDVLVARGREADAEDGDVVVVRLLSYGDTHMNPTGSVERVLGPLSDPGVDVLTVAHGFGLALEFSPAVLRAAEEAAATWSADPGPDRIDRTGLLCFTIDPSDAKDHDDALSIESLEGGLVEVGVHIADVSHFVRPSGPLDAEALERGTSVYLVDRTIPMLPPTLSADVCSLRRDADRFAVSLFLTLDADGRVRERRYERTVIRCRHALSYEDAQEVLDGSRSIAPDLDHALRSLDDHARRIREDRRSRGSLDLDLPEAEVILDSEGLPVDIRRRERRESHRLIEDYMILANEVVARDLIGSRLAGLYRVHEPPSAESVEELAEALAPLGLGISRRGPIGPKDIQTLLSTPDGPEERALVSNLVLRTLKKARYDPQNLGHFGLASTGYAHFTSPIRRYPDLVVHRAVAAAFLGAPPLADADRGALAAVAEHASAREQAAEEAERATVALKKVEFMERHLGDLFHGRITGVAAFGFFVTLEDFFVEGLVHVRSLHDDFYRLGGHDYSLVGARSGRTFRLGDRVEVQVVRVDKEARHIDFLATEKPLPVD